MTTEADRAEYEQWWLSQWDGGLSLSRHPDGTCVLDASYTAWLAWRKCEQRYADLEREKQATDDFLMAAREKITELEAMLGPALEALIQVQAVLAAAKAEKKP